jgi:hypothetical protein
MRRLVVQEKQVIDGAAKHTHDIEKPVTLGQIAVLMTQFYKNLKLDNDILELELEYPI